MQKLLLILVLFSFHFVSNGQLTPARKANKSTIKKKPLTHMTKKAATKVSTIQPGDTATVPKINYDPASIKQPKSFDPTSGKINNLPVKTPVYNSNVTGTGAPGDANTGVPANRSNYPPVNNGLKDSLKN